MSTIKKITRYFVFVALGASGLILLVSAGFLVYATVTDYKPAEVESISIPTTILPDTIPAGQLEIYTWNISYCGLSAEMDFFYENGRMVRPGKAYYERCRDGVLKQLSAFGRPDLFCYRK